MHRIHGQRLKIRTYTFLATQAPQTKPYFLNSKQYQFICSQIPTLTCKCKTKSQKPNPKEDEPDEPLAMQKHLNRVRSRATERVVVGTIMRPKHCNITGELLVTPSHGQSGPGKSASIRLYSRTNIDPRTGRAKLSNKACFKNGKSSEIDKHKGLKLVTYHVKITTEAGFGIPGAFLINNCDKHKFFLQSASFQVEGGQSVHFDCNSWVYPAKDTKNGIVFFSNTSYLPNQTPEALVELRKEELKCLRGDGTGERKDGDRIYDYDYYNDLGNPDKGLEHDRPVLGGKRSHPYPRRLRTGRPSCKKYPSAESRLEMTDINVFVPPYEQFSPKKLHELLSNSIVHFLVKEKASLQGEDLGTFSSFDNIQKLFSTDRTGSFVPNKVKKKVLNEQPKKTCVRKQKTPKFPVPQIIAENEWAWKDDKEFAHQMLAGTNPARIELLKGFPPVSRTGEYSSIRTAHLEQNLDGLTVEQAMSKNRLFILDHHDYLLPFLAKINMKDVRAYASRTLLFLGEDDILKPVVIELTLPRTSYSNDVDRVFLPASHGTEAALWQLAKAHVGANDSAYHHLISHWLHTHAVIEPFVIATRRQLSMMHPIHKLLDPHFKDTIHINGLARSFLINSGGILETTLFTKNVSMELSSMLYKKWRFDEQALPSDLLKRGMAVEDPDSPAGVKLILEDYPYAADGLEIWNAITTWVENYCSIFYKDDSSVRFDEELQAWWSEIRNMGHGDKKNEHWWSEMKTRSDLIETLTTIIWITSGLHASVSSGQYAYCGYPPNRPAMCRQFIPAEGTFEFAEFLRDSDRYYLHMLPGRLEMTLMIAMTEVLSRHTSDEVYLGQRASSKWTDNEEIQQSFVRFDENLKQIQERILERNKDPNLKHRSGPAKIHYDILIPREGIPNSISM